MPKMQVSRKRKASKSRNGGQSSRLLGYKAAETWMNHTTEVWPIAKHTLKFYTNATTALSVTSSMLLDAINVTLTAASAVQLYDFVRVKRIGLMSAATAANGISTVNLAFTGATAGATGNDLDFSASSMNPTEPACLVAKPPTGALSTLWQANTNSVLFRLTSVNNTGAAGATAQTPMLVKLELEYRMDSDTPALATTNAPVGAAAGIVYFRGLDQLRTGLTAWQSILTPVN